MRKGKVVIKKIEERIKRQVTFSKRRKSLMKKAQELSILCDVHIGLFIFSQSNKLYSFCSHSTSMENLIMRYQKEKEGHTTADHSFHPDHGSNCAEMKESMMREINNLKLNLLLYEGHGLNLLTYDDLLRFELQLQFSLQIARARKVELMQQQRDKVKGKGKGKGKEILNVDEETQHFYQPGRGSSWEHLMWQAERHMMTCQRQEEDSDVKIQHVKKVFPFDGEEQPTGVLHFLRTLLPLPSKADPSSGPNQ